MVADLRAGPPAWAIFSADPDAQLCYYRALAEVLCDGELADPYLGPELHAAIDEIESLTDLGLETDAWNAAHSALSCLEPALRAIPTGHGYGANPAIEEF